MHGIRGRRSTLPRCRLPWSIERPDHPCASSRFRRSVSCETPTPRARERRLPPARRRSLSATSSPGARTRERPRPGRLCGRIRRWGASGGACRSDARAMPARASARRIASRLTPDSVASVRMLVPERSRPTMSTTSPARGRRHGSAGGSDSSTGKSHCWVERLRSPPRSPDPALSARLSHERAKSSPRRPP